MAHSLPDSQYLNRIARFLYDQFEGFQLDSSHQRLSVNLVFHTWVAIWKVGIPDGTRLFNGKLIDYVSKIKREAIMLEAQRIPSAIVYSRLELPLKEEKALLANFSCEENLVLLCLEDMPHSIPPSSYSRNYTADLKLMDHLRLAVIKHAPDVLKELRRKALQERKEQYVSFLDGNGGNAIMYADMDMVFTADRVPVVYAKNGMCSYPQFSLVFTSEKHPNANMNPELAKRINNNASVFRRDWKVVAEYVMSGEAHKVSYALAMELGRTWLPCIAHGENCMMLVAYSSITMFRELVCDNDLIVDLHGNDTEFWRENHTLMYLQLLPYMKHMSDNTWICKNSGCDDE